MVNNDKIFAYCKETIEDFDLQYEVALKRIDHCRCPLRMVDSYFYAQIERAIEDWCIDNDVNVEDVDIEEIFG